MQSRAVTLLITVATLLSQSDGRLNNAPQDTESKVGDTTYFNCSTNLTSKEIFWNHGDQYVYSENGILAPYDERFEIDKNASIGSYNLVIHSVNHSDAGEYICIDDDGHGTRRSAHLIVLDDDPDCQSNIQPDGVIGQNVFNIPPDEVQLTCNVTYHGNIPPQMEWRKVGDNSSTKFNVTSQLRAGNRLTHTLNLKGDISLDKSSYVCQTRRSRLKQYTCSSEVIKVLYFIGGNLTEENVFRGDEITCIDSNNTFPCTHEWYHDNYTCPLSCAETITTRLLGEYLCTVKCNVRGTEYSYKALQTVVREVAETPSPFTPGTIAVAVLVPIVMTGLIVLIAAYTVRHKIQTSKREAEELMQLEMRIMKLMEKRFKNEQQGTVEYVEDEIELLHKIHRKEIAEDKTIFGVAIFGTKLFLVLKESPQLEVHDCNDFSLACKPIQVKELVAPLDICSCKKGNCLYIMDTKDLYVTDATDQGTYTFDIKEKFEARKVFKIDTNGAVLKTWPTKNDACGFLSTTSEGNVIITVQDAHMLMEYSSDGKWVCDIKLPGCIRPWHAIKRDDGQYIVSHGTYDHLHRVCLVNEKGHTVGSFGEEMGSTATQLHIPYYLAVGSSGYVFVADLCNNRMLLLDKDLKFKANIVPEYKQRFKSPRRIYLDEELRVLVVVIGEGLPQDTDPVNSDYTMSSIHGEAHGSMQKTEKGTTSKEVDDSLKPIHAEAKDSWEEPEETDKLIEHDDSLTTRMKECEVLQIIEKDCRLLVFNIQPLMQKYFSSSKSEESCL